MVISYSKSYVNIFIREFKHCKIIITERVVVIEVVKCNNINKYETIQKVIDKDLHLNQLPYKDKFVSGQDYLYKQTLFIICIIFSISEPI